MSSVIELTDSDIDMAVTKNTPRSELQVKGQAFGLPHHLFCWPASSIATSHLHVFTTYCITHIFCV